MALPKVASVRMLRTRVLFVAVGAIWAALPSSVTAALVIENNFTGTGPLKITLEQESIKDVVDCTGSTIKGTVSSPPDAKAKLSSWTMSGCTASSGGESFGSATVTVLFSLPAVEALSTNSVKVGSLTVRAEYKVNGSTCKPEVMMGSGWNYSYTNGSSTNQLSAKVPHIFGIPEGLPPPECLDGGLGYFEPSFSFTNPQFEVASGSQFLLRNENAAGSPSLAFLYGLPGDKAAVGDWDNNGTTTVGVKQGGDFYLRNSNSSGAPNISFSFGNSEDLPIAGDWNNDGTDTIGVYRPSNRTFYLRNSNSGGAADITVDFGNNGDLPIVGDWNNDGTDTIGVYRPSNRTFYLRNSNSNGVADIAVDWGNPGDLPIVGDWNNDGTDTFGVYRPGSTAFYMRNSNSSGAADISAVYGSSDDTPIVGDWNGDGTTTIGVLR